MTFPSTRRTLLSAAALVAPASLLPAIAAAAEGKSFTTTDFRAPDPHPAWYAEWRALLDWCNTTEEAAHLDLDEVPQWHRVGELERLIGATPARTLAGATAQLRVLHHWCGDSIYVGENLDVGLDNALATLERLLGEARHA